jgi:hypothetical protein
MPDMVGKTEEREQKQQHQRIDGIQSGRGKRGTNAGTSEIIESQQWSEKQRGEKLANQK